MANALTTKHSAQPSPVATTDAAPAHPTSPDAMVNPFHQAALESVQPGDDRTRTITGSSSQSQSGIDVPATGYLRHVVIDVEATGSVKGGNTVAAQADAPYSALDEISLTDVNGTPIVGPMSGYELYAANKYGAYTNETDPANLPSFQAVDTDGDFSFKLRQPVEISGRDALGALPNMDASQTFKVGYNIAAGSKVYATPPATTLPDVRVRQFIESWTQPPAADLRGVPNRQTPPALGTTQYWSRQVHNVVAAEQRIRLSRVGNQIRTLVLITRNSSGARVDSIMPDDIRVEVDGQNWLVTTRRLVLDQMQERYGFAPDLGVYVLDFSHDLDGKPGHELRTGYLPTTQATRVEISGTFKAVGTLTILTNDVAARAVIADA